MRSGWLPDPVPPVCPEYLVCVGTSGCVPVSVEVGGTTGSVLVPRWSWLYGDSLMHFLHLHSSCLRVFIDTDTCAFVSVTFLHWVACVDPYDALVIWGAGVEQVVYEHGLGTRSRTSKL